MYDVLHVTRSFNNAAHKDKLDRPGSPCKILFRVFRADECYTAVFYMAPPALSKMRAVAIPIRDGLFLSFNGDEITHHTVVFLKSEELKRPHVSFRHEGQRILLVDGMDEVTEVHHRARAGIVGMCLSRSCE